MKKKDKDRLLLAEGMGKFARIREGSGNDEGPDNCALCEEYFDDGKCNGCPIMDKTGLVRCLDTPYPAWEEHQSIEHDSDFKDMRIYDDCPQCKALSMKEFNFLAALFSEL